MNKNIAIIAGGDSGEYEISIKSGEQLLKQIDKSQYNPYLLHIKGADWKASINGSIVPVDKNNFQLIHNGENIKFDCALIAIHGTPGEDGRLQSYFEIMKVPYTTCGVMSSSLTFNKYACKHYLMPYGISTGKAMLFHKNDVIKTDEVIHNLGLPCFIKPNNSGSSCGISKINKPEDIQPAIEKALNAQNISKDDIAVVVKEMRAYKMWQDLLVYCNGKIRGIDEFLKEPKNKDGKPAVSWYELSDALNKQYLVGADAAAMKDIISRIAAFEIQFYPNSLGYVARNYPEWKAYIEVLKSNYADNDTYNEKEK